MNFDLFMIFVVSLLTLISFNLSANDSSSINFNSFMNFVRYLYVSLFIVPRRFLLHVTLVFS